MGRSTLADEALLPVGDTDFILREPVILVETETTPAASFSQRHHGCRAETLPHDSASLMGGGGWNRRVRTARRAMWHGQDAHATAGEDGVLLMCLSVTLRCPPLAFFPPATRYPPETQGLPAFILQACVTLSIGITFLRMCSLISGFSTWIRKYGVV